MKKNRVNLFRRKDLFYDAEKLRKLEAIANTLLEFVSCGNLKQQKPYF